MKSRIIRNAFRVVSVVGAIVVAVGVSQQSTEAQGARARVTPAATAQDPELTRLKRRVDSLEARLEKLEAGDLEEVKDDAEAEQKAAKEAAALERRLARIEQGVEAARSGAPGKRGAANDEVSSLTVRAPFSVLDGAGNPIMRVLDDLRDQTNRGVYVYDRSGKFAVAHLGAIMGAGGRVYLANATDGPPSVILATGAEGSDFRMQNKTAAQLFLGVKNSRGYFELSDPSGNKMVEAGSLVSGRGYVLVNPWKTSTDLAGDPSVLMGGKKK